MPKAGQVGIYPINVRRVCAKLLREGHDSKALLAAAGLSPELLSDREDLISLDVIRQFVSACQGVVGRPTLALECGWEAPLTDLGLVGLLIASAEDLRQALQATQCFVILVSAFLRDMLVEADGGIWVVIDSTRPLGDLHAFVLDYTVGVFGRIISETVPGSREGARLQVPWSAPPWRTFYEKIAGQVEFNCGRMAFWIPDGLLNRANPTGNKVTHEATRALAVQEVKRLSASTTLHNRLTALQQDPEFRWQSAHELAKELGVSTSTLGRHLKKSGKSHRQLQEEQRRERATWLLGHTSEPVSSIAQQLGYLSESNFSRAFRRWYDMSPSAYRLGTKNGLLKE
ncbi:AraC family transcriptional regulator ligand-binding domain-containing protein [Hydrogenophaga sp. T2]|uniref:AraC family transcriptional regulator n=1 Tax=Hydrogenophaga sp. T2 TaxID=3132823 RepID=UPI003CFA6A97